jgi:hypothetical protein
MTTLKIKIILRYGTQRNFAQKCGKTDDWISKILRGVMLPTAAEKKLMAWQLRISIKRLEAFLYSSKTNPHPPILGPPLVERGKNEKPEPGTQSGI